MIEKQERKVTIHKNIYKYDHQTYEKMSNHINREMQISITQRHFSSLKLFKK